jgi:hypothetical protein
MAKKARSKKYRATYAGQTPVTLRLATSDAQKGIAHIALLKLAAGTGTTAHFNTIIGRLNASKLLAEQVFESAEAIEKIVQGMAACLFIRGRYRSSNQWHCDALEQAKIGEALIICDQIQDEASNREYRSATAIAQRAAREVGNALTV